MRNAVRKAGSKKVQELREELQPAMPQGWDKEESSSAARGEAGNDGKHIPIIIFLPPPPGLPPGGVVLVVV